MATSPTFFEPTPPDGTADGDSCPLVDRELQASLRQETEAIDPTMLSDLTRDWRRDAPGWVAEVAAALGAGDLETARIRVHRMKGASAVIGLARVAARARVVEMAAKSGSVTAAQAAMAGLSEALVATLATDLGMGDAG